MKKDSKKYIIELIHYFRGEFADMSKRGMLIVLSGPSGVGKGTIRKAIFEQDDNKFHYSISMTTRKKRPGEVDGKDYFFVSKDEFEKEIATGGMLEYARYVDNYYGTPLKYVNEMLDSGKDVFLEIEVRGAMQVREKCTDGLFIFLTPPDLMELRHRIIERGTDDLATIDKRMKKAVGEIEMMQNYDYAVVNDEIPAAVEKIKTIIRAERWRVKRFLPDYKKQLGDVLK
ncbi:guanylate kinase [Liquorilactobacillus satsumensis DSM 16230 = JCM 12392]|uniref:Guanylate kinase n=2 Tax=Liquorilactobacillus satsumensis TaxID=259059 RepID=A0A0R1V2Q2_9LACO|nr:guanylate kinase [Liquorilactobacillus satsumensis DSM 16230 = JCM 12392]